MDPLTGNIAEGLVDHPVPANPRQTGKGRALDHHGEMRFPRSIVARMTVMRGAIVDHIQMKRGKSLLQYLVHFAFKRSCFRSNGHVGVPFFAACPHPMPVRQSKFHGRYEADGRLCAVPGCDEAGEFRAPGGRSPGFDGPGEYRFMCLDHVRAHNSGYDFFDGMSADEMFSAQGTTAGWENVSRAYAGVGDDGLPRWADFADPLDAIGARAENIRNAAGRTAATARPASPGSRFTREEVQALDVMGLARDIDRKALRRRYSELVRCYHPDRNGGDRTHEVRLMRVVDAYKLLRESDVLV